MTEPPTVLVLAGGPDGERAVSIHGGETVADGLRDAGATVAHRVIDRPTRTELAEIMKSSAADLVFPLLHGPWGEGGDLQALLESLGVPFVGSRETGSRLAMDKRAAKAGVRSVLPNGVVVLDEFGVEWDDTSDRARLNPGCLPVVVKPNADGSSFGVTICTDEEAFQAAIAAARESARDVIVEPFVRGREITVPLLQQPGGGWTALPVCEVAPAAGVYDYDAKYHRDDTRYTVRPELPPGMAEAVELATVAIAERLALRHLCRADYIIDEHGGAPRAVFLEVNTIPGFTAHSFFPMCAAAAGIPLPELCDRLIRLALADTPAGTR